MLLLGVLAWGGWPRPDTRAVDAGGGGSVAYPGGDGGFPWVPDRRDGTYRNPVILADYSDPDVIRVGWDYYLVASSFNATPALPILHSRDLVNWTIVGHALANLPHPRFAAVQAGAGVWAPAWGRHNDTFYLFVPMPDEGIYVLTAAAPVGPWSPPRLLIAGKGLIDPCPFWDDDGRAYLVHAYAKSRSGIKSKLRLVPMAPDASRLLGEGAIIFDGTTRQPTIEGPKLYKRNGWYIVLAPAGGVATGWQVALRSRNIWGPYEDRVVLAQGRTTINGPHQGALVDTPDGKQWWFVHFQDMGVYGRVTHLNPVVWVDDWPLMGEAAPGAGTSPSVRQPLLGHAKPATPSEPMRVPQTSDDFNAPALGPQWQWNANHDDAWISLSARPGFLRMVPQRIADPDLRLAPNLLLQKFPARSFTVETTVELIGVELGTQAGLVVLGKAYAALTVEPAGLAHEPASPSVGQRHTLRVTFSVDGRVVHSDSLSSGAIRLRIAVADGGLCSFSFGSANGPPRPVTHTFQAQAGRWVGARVGLFAVRAGTDGGSAHADFAEFRFGPPDTPPAVGH